MFIDIMPRHVFLRRVTMRDAELSMLRLSRAGERRAYEVVQQRGCIRECYEDPFALRYTSATRHSSAHVAALLAYRRHFFRYDAAMLPYAADD